MNRPYSTMPPNSEAADGAPPTSAVHILHRALRGRYFIAAGLAITLATAGVLAGYNLTVPKYKAAGSITIDPTIRATLHPVPENEQIPMFDTYVDTEAQYVTTDRTLNLAISSASPGDRWAQQLQELGWPKGTEGVTQLRRTLVVRRTRPEAFIHVFGIHEDAKAAQLAVNAVLEAYLRLHNERMGSPIDRERELRGLVERYDREIKAEEDALLAKADAYGTSDLLSWHAKKLQQVAELESSLLEIQKRIVMKQDADSAATGGIPDSTPAPNYPSLQSLAALDRDLAALIQLRDQVAGEIEAKAGAFGENHREMVALRGQRDSLQGRIDSRVRELQLLWEAGALAVDDAGTVTPQGDLSLAQLRDLEKRHQELVNAQRDELRSLTQTMTEIERHQQQIAILQGLRSEAKIGLEQLRVEFDRIRRGRADIQTAGMPTHTEVDKRMQFAALGGGAGLALGVGLVIAYGFVRPSYRYLDDLEGDRLPVPVLGSLPDLGGAGTMNDDLVSLNIHHLRNVLQLRAAGRGDDLGMAYLVTSGRPGDGKTSLALALAMSFAIEGRRTVLVDTDFIGRGLTHSLNLSRAAGFAQAIEGDPIENCLHETQVPHLQAMPTGPQDTCKPERMSEKNMRMVLGALRRRADFIVLDTGPLLGSLEANLAASLVDHVLLMVPRGQQPSVLRATLERIHRLGGDCAGIIFNRASAVDLERSVSQFSFQGQSVRRSVIQDGMGRDSGSAPSRAMIHALMNQTEIRPETDEHAPTNGTVGHPDIDLEVNAQEPASTK